MELENGKKKKTTEEWELFAHACERENLNASAELCKVSGIGTYIIIFSLKYSMFNV